MMIRSRTVLLTMTVSVLLTFAAACTASQPAVRAGDALPGFMLGFWQGLIAPVAFLISLFDGEVRIYAFPNAGRWYDLGFMLGIGGFSSSAAAGSRQYSARERESKK
jgi:hypothetical protein